MSNLPTNPIRYAIWAAVSTETQAAEDKFSLETQVEKSRATANAKGWDETSGPYIVPGESRTRFINLSDAERQIPQLRQLLDEAQDDKFDVVVCLEYDRFRELLDPVARTLAHYGVQIYSVNQPIEPQNPETYGPYTSDSEFMLRGLNQMISRAAIANLRRKYASEMPKRVLERGLTAASLPWGYRKPPGQETKHDAIPELIPEIAEHLRWMKDWLLAGRSTYQIVNELDRLEVPIPAKRKRHYGRTKWDATTVRRILGNPFYAGLVRWGVSKTTRDLRTGQSIKALQPKDTVQIAPGKHQGVWDESTWRAIEAEFERRAPRYRGRKTRQLSGLLICGECNAVLWRHTRTKGNKRKPENRYMSWRCSVAWTSHMSHPNTLMLEQVAKTLQEILNGQITAPVEATNQNELLELREKRASLLDLYLEKLVDKPTYISRLMPLDKRINELEQIERDNKAIDDAGRARDQAIHALREISEKVGILYWLQNDDPNQVNAALHHLVKHFVVDKDGNITQAVIK
jgi:hypothetical protein